MTCAMLSLCFLLGKAKTRQTAKKIPIDPDTKKGSSKPPSS